MKFALSQLVDFVGERQARRNLGALLTYLLFLLAVISFYSVFFHLIMLHIEGQEHSWLTGFYWTLTVMSTLGFGDITFHTDSGRLFSIAVLLSGIVLLLIMLPFVFIRYFYAPWLEAQIRLHVPRGVPEGTSGHVIICRYDSICPGLIQKLQFNRIPYFVIEPDPAKAAQMISDDISVIAGEIDSSLTYKKLRVPDARMVFANAEDAVNSNITLTVREVSRDVDVVALVEDEDSIDILELSGATQVLPLKRLLGEHLAARTKAGSGAALIVGSFKGLQIAEFVAHGTNLAGKTLRDTRLRELTGVSVVGMWDQGNLRPAHPGMRFSDPAVLVVIGSPDQIERLNTLLASDASLQRPVLVIGGGRVGMAVAQALLRRGAPVHLIEKNQFRGKLPGVRFIQGDAADRTVLQQAGLEEASAVVLTTNADAVNIYLTVYCRRLRPGMNIVCRITHERNIESIYRAGADSVLSYSSLGKEYMISSLLGREPVLLGAAADFFLTPVPQSLFEKPLGESQIGSRTGLLVIGVENNGETVSAPPPSLPLPAGGQLLMLGTAEQRKAFSAEFG